MMKVDILLIAASVCGSLVAARVCRRMLILRMDAQSKKNDGDIESNFPFLRIPIPFLLRHQRRAVVVACIALFLLMSLMHEWIQESMQIHGDMQAAIQRGPPQACDYEVYTPWWSMSGVDRDRECQTYINRVHRLPIANPITALIRLGSKLIVDPWLCITSAIGEGLHTMLAQQSFATQLLLFVSVVVVAVSMIQLCCVSVCNPNSVIGQYFLSRTTMRSRLVARRQYQHQFRIEDVS